MDRVISFSRSISSKLLGFTDDSGQNAEPFPFKEEEKLNPSVYLLHKSPKEPNLNILFFHGLQLGNHSNSYLSTWVSGDRTQLWPQIWLAEELPNANIYSISYETSLDANSQNARLDLRSIGENLIESLIGQTDVGQRPGCPIVLVGHSFGGLVIKQFCTQAHEIQTFSKHEVKIKQFLKNVGGVFYYATPHHGVPFDMADRFVKGPLLDYVKLLSTKSTR